MDTNALINEMMKHGHTYSTAQATVAGRSGDSLINLWNEYMPNKIEKPQTPEQYAQSLVDAAQAQIKKETEWVNKYLTDNPFVFDEELAKLSSSAEYLPYYTELLQDYLTDVNRQRETTQDEQRLLRELRRLDVGERTRAYDYAVEEAERGAQGRGVFSSGMRARDVGKQDIAYKTGMEEATDKYMAGEKGLEDILRGYDIAEEQRRRDLFGSYEELGGVAGYELPTGERGGAFQEALEGGIQQRYGESIKPYLSTYEQAYKSQFQPSTMKATDYLPASYLQY